MPVLEKALKNKLAIRFFEFIFGKGREVKKMSIIQIVWVLLLVGFVVLEAATVSIVSIWFALGAGAALLVSAFIPGAWGIQIAVFLLVSIVALLGLRPLARRYGAQRRQPTNADANIGKVCQVVAEIQPGRIGRVKLEGLEWAARADRKSVV